MGLENLVWAKLWPDITPHPKKKKKKLPSPLLKLDDASLTLQIWNQKRNLSKKLLLRASLRSDQISLSLSHHMAPVAPRSGDAIFASVERVVSPKAPPFSHFKKLPVFNSIISDSFSREPNGALKNWCRMRSCLP